MQCNLEDSTVSLSMLLERQLALVAFLNDGCAHAIVFPSELLK